MFKKFDNICRLCMTGTKCMIQLFEDESVHIPEKIMLLIPSIKVYADDNLPSQVCEGCIDQVNSFSNFKLQCEKSYETLKQYWIKQEDNNTEETCQESTAIEDRLTLEPAKIREKNHMQNDCKTEDEFANRVYSEVKEEVIIEEHDYDAMLPEEDVKFTILNEDSASSIKKNEQSKKISVSCDICGKIMVKKRLNEHMKQHSGARPFKCEVCGKSFAYKDSLKKHSLMVHSGIKTHICDVCGKGFKQLSALKLHQLTHTGEKPHVCDVCGKGFNQLGSFKMHKLLHQGVKPFSCDICGKSYSQRNTLLLHLAVHSGERQHLCKICGKGFLLKGHLRTHMVVHTGEKKFSCEICGTSYTQSQSLKKHKRKHDIL